MAGQKGKPIELYGTERDLFGLLKKRYPAPSWALIPQVANGTGSNARRWADAIALSCWPSMGLELHGFEIKTYRGDWLRELGNGEKSQAVWKFCDRWWILAANDAVVLPGELPKTWGLIVPKGQKLHTVVAAPVLKPKPLTKTFVASILRNAMEVCVPDAAIRQEYDRGKAEGLKEGEESGKYHLERAKKKVAAIEAAISAFETTACVKFPGVSEWMTHVTDHEAFGAAVRQVLAGRDGHLVNGLLSVRDKARALADEVDKRLTEAKKPEESL
jgi:hypothetical protein